MKEIREIIQAYDKLDHETTKCAMAQVVHVEGSSYRRIGARMLVTDGGTWTGGISGGCLEGDALKRAKIAILKNRASSVIYDTTKDDEYQIGVGLGCNGLIETLFVPIDPHDIDNPIQKLRRLCDRRERSVLVTYLDDDGPIDSMGGSAIFPDSEQLSANFAELSEVVEHLEKKKGSKICQLTDPNGKESRNLVEIIRPQTRLAIVGDNYDIYPLINLAQALGWKVDLYANLRKLRSDACLQKTKIFAKEKFSEQALDAFTAVILMNHDYAWDKTCLTHFIKCDFPYLGVLGPKIRKDRMLNELIEEGMDLNSQLSSHLFSPSGLDIGAEGPEQIALSICSEIIAAINDRPACYLRERKGTIHPRD